MRIMERDILILREIDRWRFLLSRHIQVLCGFSGDRACDRRLKILIESGFIERQKIFYGVPSFYLLTHQGKLLIGASHKKDKIRVEQAKHDILALDTAIYLKERFDLSHNDFTTEKELHQNDGFSNRKHVPDFLINHGTYVTCVEIELTLKAKETFLKNLKDNFLKYDSQIWVISKRDTRNRKLIENSGFTDIEIIDCEWIETHAKKR